MAITKPRALSTKSVDDFISAAPDAAPKIPGVKKGHKQQISLTITPDMLSRVDEKAAELGLGRAGLINLAIAQMLDKGFSVDGKKR